MAELQTILQVGFVGYGGISAAGNTTEQSIPDGVTYTKIVNYDTNSVSRNVTPDFTLSQITTLSSGTYKLDSSFSYSADSGNTGTLIALFVNGVEYDPAHLNRKIGVGGDVGNASMTGLLELIENDIVDARVRHDAGGAVGFTFTYMNLNIEKVDN